MKWVDGLIEKREIAAEKARAAREEENAFYTKMGKQIAVFADEQSADFIQQTFKESLPYQNVAIRELQESLRYLANGLLMKFLSDDTLGREIALNTHIAPHSTGNAELVALTHVIRERLDAIGDARFSTDLQKRDMINTFDKRVLAQIRLMSDAVELRKEPEPASLYM